MSKFQIQAHELVMSRDEKSAFADSFIFEPENIEEQALGNLYIIGEVTNFSENSSYLINLLISIVKREYYSNSKRSPLDGLEAALHKANSTLADFAEQGNIEWINNLNITIAVLKDKELHFSQTGHCCVLLVRNGEIANISHGLTSEKNNNHLKTFANIASGQVEMGDQLILATESFLNIVSESEIKKISELDFGEKVKELEKVVRGSKESVESASIIILEAGDFKETVKKLNHIEISNDISSPIGIPEKTPSVAVQNFIYEKNKSDYSEKTESRFDAPGEIYETEGSGKNIGAKEAVIGILKNAIAALFKYSRIAILKFSEYAAAAIIKFIEFSKVKLAPALKNAASSVVAAVSRKINKKEKQNEESADFSGDKTVEPEQAAAAEANGLLPAINISEEPIAEGQNLNIAQSETINAAPSVKLPPIFNNKKFIPIKTRYIFSFINARNIVILFATVLVIFTTSVVVVVRDQKNTEQNIVLYNDMLKEAVQKKEAAELAFIIKEETKAKSLLKESEISLNKVYSSGYFKDEAAKELAFISSVVEKMDKINILAEPVALSDFSALDNAANTGRLLVFDNTVYLYGGEKNSIYAYDTIKGVSSRVKANYANVGNLKAGTVSSDKKIIFYNDTPGVAIFDVKKNEIKPADIALPKNNPAIKDIIAFDAYFYILDSANEQIIKYKRTTGGFADGKDWITQKGGNSLAKAVSFTVDGSLYILDDNGKIYKYYGGEAKEFNQYPLFDTIGEGGRIITRSNFKNLYVLDPANKRIVIFDKTGNLVKQIKSEKFDSLKDMAIIDEKTAYVLNGTKIYKIGL